MLQQVYASVTAVLEAVQAGELAMGEAPAAIAAVQSRESALADARKKGESEVRKAEDIAPGVKCAIDSWGNLTLSGFDRIGHGSGRMAASLSGSALVCLLQNAKVVIGKLARGIGEGTERAESYAKKTDKDGAKTGIRHYVGAVRIAEKDATFVEDVAALCDKHSVEV
jgi:hypothetical protein